MKTGEPVCTFSPCRKYRYTLWREVNPEGDGTVVFIGLNPSTADETKNDPTVTRCMNRAKALGARWFCMLNVFAYRATNPKDMKAQENPVGPDNWKHVADVARRAKVVIAAWGVHGSWKDGADYIRIALRGNMGSYYEAGIPDVQFKCLGKTRDGHPRHPLYIRADKELENYP